MNYSDKVFKITSLIPKGKVTSYKQISKLAKIKNPRLAGFILHKNKNPKKIPCHRVIKANGFLATGYAFGGITEQRKKLENEGIVFSNDGKIDSKKYFLDLSDKIPLRKKSQHNNA